MAGEYNPPNKGEALIFYIGLDDPNNEGKFKSNPTIAAGDFQVSIDDGALANLATTPSVSPASSKRVKISLTAAEMTGDNITIIGSDQTSPNEWNDFMVNIVTS